MHATCCFVLTVIVRWQPVGVGLGWVRLGWDGWGGWKGKFPNFVEFYFDFALKTSEFQFLTIQDEALFKPQDDRDTHQNHNTTQPPAEEPDQQRPGPPTNLHRLLPWVHLIWMFSSNFRLWAGCCARVVYGSRRASSLSSFTPQSCVFLYQMKR